MGENGEVGEDGGVGEVGEDGGMGEDGEEPILDDSLSTILILISLSKFDFLIINVLNQNVN